MGVLKSCGIVIRHYEWIEQVWVDTRNRNILEVSQTMQRRDGMEERWKYWTACSEDPFCHLEQKVAHSSGDLEWVDWHKVAYADMYNYLIHTPSQYTHKTLKANKSMDGTIIS